MSGAVVRRLVTAPERVGREAAQRVFEFVDSLPGDALSAPERLVLQRALSRVVSPDFEVGLWPGGFAMLSKDQIAQVWDAIRALPGKDRPHMVRHALDLVLLNLRTDTGEVLLTRDQFAAAMKCSPDRVSAVMAVLARMGVILRTRSKVAGMRGPGVASYFVNPRVAWEGNLRVRASEAARAPQLSLALSSGVVRGRRPSLSLVT